MKNNIVITIIAIVIVGGISFFAGIQYQKTQGSSFARVGRQGGSAGRFGQAGMRPVAGEIINSDDKSITVKMQDGSTKIVIVSSSTSINKTANGTKSDLKSGEKVAVFGQQNADGSVTAQNIQLNPQMRMFPKK